MNACRLFVLAVLLAACVGCSAFRWGERSYQEVEERNQQEREAEKVLFRNDEVLSSK